MMWYDLKGQLSGLYQCYDEETRSLLQAQNAYQKTPPGHVLFPDIVPLIDSLELGYESISFPLRMHQQRLTSRPRR